MAIESILVKFLRDLLAEAEAGRVPGFAIILPANGQVQVTVHGSVSPSDLYFGCGILERQILDASTTKQSPIMQLQAGFKI